MSPRKTNFMELCSIMTTNELPEKKSDSCFDHLSNLRSGSASSISIFFSFQTRSGYCTKSLEEPCRLQSLLSQMLLSDYLVHVWFTDYTKKKKIKIKISGSRNQGCCQSYSILALGHNSFHIGRKFQLLVKTTQKVMKG